MKGILCACLLISLLSTAQAFEADIHYSTTYVLARAAGWTDADALTIASADQAVDENQDTVAALEVDAIPGSLRQAEKNLQLHCFSRTHGQAGRISADVLEVMSGHFAEVPDRDVNPRSHATRLIALGAALHCQQDAYAHVGFGGSCGSHPGSCDGHAYQTFLDQVVFGLLGKHYFNPDHPGVSGQWLPRALEGTVTELASRRPKGSLRPVPASELSALSDSLRGSGLELPDEVRLACNRYIAGKWLFDFIHSDGSADGSPDTVENLGPEVADTCRNPSLGSATIVRIPDPRFPRLNPDASPRLVRTDGTYQLVRDGEPGGLSPLPNYNARRDRLQFSHWTQLVALPRMSMTR